MILKLLRANQWYKNLVVFLAVFFSKNLFDINLLILTVLGFVSLCLISSTNYIINDIVDLKKDRLHPEKKSRPIASGRIKISMAMIIAIISFFISLILALNLSLNFFFSIAAIFIFTTIYTFFLKKIIFFDIITISANFAIRAIAGALLINVWVSPFLIAYPFFFALFLSTGKRYSDFALLKGKDKYSKIILKPIIYLTIITIIIIYTVYCFITNYLLLITLPIMIYALFRYLNLILSASKTARHPELIFKDIRLILSIILFLALLLIFFYPIFF